MGPKNIYEMAQWRQWQGATTAPCVLAPSLPQKLSSATTSAPSRACAASNVLPRPGAAEACTTGKTRGRATQRRGALNPRRHKAGWKGRDVAPASYPRPPPTAPAAPRAAPAWVIVSPMAVEVLPKRRRKLISPPMLRPGGNMSLISDIR